MDTSYSPEGFGRYGLDPAGRQTPAQSELHSVATPGDVAAESHPWSPASPLFWFGVLAAITLGLAAVSTSVRVGPVKAGVQLGK